MSVEEQIEFDCDFKKIDWSNYLRDYAKGLFIYTLKEDIVAPKHNL